MSRALVISVRLHEGWYHGAGSIPSPARLFQALIAGKGLSGPLPTQTTTALEWLEQKKPPIVATPVTKHGQTIATYVPNNDLDAKQGDHRRIGEIRTKKSIRPLLFDSEVPFMFCWELVEDEPLELIQHICELTDSVYQLGRTVDAAWAWADVLAAEELFERFREHRGPVHYPTEGRGFFECPTAGSLASLERRHADMSGRYAITADGRGQTFRRRAKPKWKMISYENATNRVCFDLIDRETSSPMPWPTTDVVALVTRVRDAAATKLIAALPDREPEINQTLVGRKPNGEHAGPISSRVRIIPLPSIGDEHADQQIRRILIEIPTSCALRSDDILWGFSGQTHMIHDRTIDLLRSQPHRQMEHYGITAGSSCSVWRTVTPIALSNAARRRIEPDPMKRGSEEPKGAAERRLEQEIATNALRHSLRHAGVLAGLTSVRLQREPCTSRGQKADDFASGDRFNRHVLWHAVLHFDAVLRGPLLLGDGRFLGLGLLQPVTQLPGVYAFTVESGLSEKLDAQRLAKSLRRAVMARVRDAITSPQLPVYFSGHLPNGDPADSFTNPHLTFVFDAALRRLLILTPEIFDNSIRTASRYEKTLERALLGFDQLLAGQDGKLRLRPLDVDASADHLFAPSRIWQSLTPYTVNRHGKKSTAEELLVRNLLAECEMRGLPRPLVTVKDWSAIKGEGLRGNVRLEFKQPLTGPIALGKTRHHGGGLFSSNAVGNEQ